MPFPFLPAGLVLAVAVLGGAFAGFGLALKLIDRTALTARTSIAPGIVTGLRNWSHQQEARPTSSPAASEPALGPLPPVSGGGRGAPPAAHPAGSQPIVDEVDVQGVPTQPVRRN